MKTKRPDFQVKNIFWIFTVITILLFTSCAVKKSFLNSSVVPAAEGYVKIKSDKNKNYVIQIEIVNLAAPGRLQTAKNAYVVWMDDGSNNVKNMGQIKSSSSFMSKVLKASFQSISSFRPVKIFITAEFEAGTQYPSNEVVLTTDSF